MKNYILLFLLLTFGVQSQTLPSPSYNNTTTNTLKIKTPATVTSVNFLPAIDADGITISKILPENVNINYTPVNYSISNTSIKQHLTGIDTRLGQISGTTAGNTQRVYFTADNTTVTAGTFFASSLSGKGSTPSGSPSALVLGDNAKGYFNKDVISASFAANTIAYGGTYSGNLTVSASPTPNATQQRFTIELYKTNNGGTPIASGISGAPVGDLGVTVIAILDSGIINLTAGAITNINVTGILTQNLTINSGERLRYHVSAAKEGTGGGNVTFGVYYGSAYNSYYDVPVAINTDGVLNKSAVTGITSTDALNALNTNKENTANKQNSLAIDGTGVKFPTVDAINNGVIYKRTIAQIRALSGALPSNNFYTTDSGKEGNWYYDASDTTSADNTGTVLVTADGKRIKRIFESNINASWFGVNGNGVFDNTTIIISMLNLYNDVSFYFETGNYNISNYIELSKKIKITGGKNVIFTQTTQKKTIFNVIVDGVTFENFTTQQTGVSEEINFPYGYGSGITFYRVKSGKVKNVSFYNSGDNTTLNPASVSGAGIYITGSDNIEVFNCKFYQCAMGVNIDDYQNVAVGNPARFTASNNNIYDSYFEDCNFGINIDYGALGGGIDFKNGTISNCRFLRKNYGKSAIESKTFACKSPLNIVNPQINGLFSEALAFLMGSYYANVSGGYIDGAYDGIVLYKQPSQAPSQSVTIDNITIRNCERAGVFSNNSIDCTVSNSDISNCKYGVLVNNFTWNLHLLGNKIHDNTYAGVKLDEVLGCKIIGGFITNNSTNVSGTGSGIIVNEPNFDSRVNGLEITSVTFDYSHWTGDIIPDTNQLYAIKTVGNYYLQSAKTVPGFVRDNIFGRCEVLDSKTEGSGNGLALRSNSYAGTRYVDFPEYLNLKNRKILSGAGSPNSVVSGSIGDIYMREDGDYRTSSYLKTSGSNTTTGWTSLQSFYPVSGVSDMNTITGFTNFATTNTPTNAPFSNYFQGIQFSAANNDNYANQIAWSIFGDAYERTKDSGTWGSWSSKNSSKIDNITSVGINIFSNSKNHIVIQNSASNLFSSLIADSRVTAGQTKEFSNLGAGLFNINIGSGVTLDGGTATVSIKKGNTLKIISTAANVWITQSNTETKADIDALPTSGNYTPTITAGVNITSPANLVAYYTKIGGVVTVNANIRINTTTTATNSDFTISLPTTILTTPTAGLLTGGGFSTSNGTNTFARVSLLNTTSVKVELVSTNTSTNDFNINFTYRDN